MFDLFSLLERLNLGVFHVDATELELRIMLPRFLALSFLADDGVVSFILDPL